MDISNQKYFKLIDINCYYGYWQDSTKPIIRMKDIRDFFKKGFSHICLTSSKALLLNTYLGNREIVKISNINKKILPVMVLPHSLEETYNFDCNVKFFRAISIKNLENHPWLRFIFDVKGVVIVPYIINLRTKFYEIANRYTTISFILTEVNYPQLDEVIWLASRTKNIYLEISDFQLCDGIEYLCKKIGVEKLIFGSNSPIYSTESALFKLHQSNVDYNSKKLIGRGNIERIVGGLL